MASLKVLHTCVHQFHLLIQWAMALFMDKPLEISMEISRLIVVVSWPIDKCTPITNNMATDSLNKKGLKQQPPLVCIRRAERHHRSSHSRAVFCSWLLRFIASARLFLQLYRPTTMTAAITPHTFRCTHCDTFLPLVAPQVYLTFTCCQDRNIRRTAQQIPSWHPKTAVAD